MYCISKDCTVPPGIFFDRRGLLAWHRLVTGRNLPAGTQPADAQPAGKLPAGTLPAGTLPAGTRY